MKRLDEAANVLRAQALSMANIGPLSSGPFHRLELQRIAWPISNSGSKNVLALDGLLSHHELA